MPRRVTSGPPFRYPYRVEWTDAAGKVRRKAFVWRGPADREAAYLRRRGFDARVVTLPRTPTDGAEG